MKDIWKDIPGWEGIYEASFDGQIRSKGKWVAFGNQKRYCKPTILKQVKDNNCRYYHVTLHDHGKQKSYLVHRLVAMAWIPNPENLPEINHIDENIFNNVVTNLMWVDRLTNVRHGTGMERARKAKINHPSNSIPIAEYSLDGELVAIYPSAVEAHRQKGYNAGCINNCIHGRLHTAYGKYWKQLL